MHWRKATGSSTLVLILSLYFFSACKGKPSSEVDFYRFIDSLKQENVLKSPFLHIDPAALTEAAYPVNSFPLYDEGSGEDILGFKRKHNLGTVEFNILFSPPRSEYGFNVILPKDGVLDFGIGIVRDQNSESLRTRITGKEEGVGFIVLLEVRGRKKTIFQKHLKMPPLQETRTMNFSQNKVVLPVGNQEARLTLITGGEEGPFAFWVNPVLYDRAKKRTNVILVSIDTLRADHLGVYGYGRDTSPAMDSLARESAVFLNTYASSPWTLPSHVSMLTSLIGLHHQVYVREERMDPGLMTLADFLRTNGYYCAALTGGVFVSPAYGFSKGFDIFEIHGGEVKAADLAGQCFQGVARWLEANSEKNFFLFIHTYQTHSPYRSPLPYNAMFLGDQPRRLSFDVLEDLGGEAGVFKNLPEADRLDIIGLYDGEIRYTDESLIKPLVERLRQLDLFDRTMLIVTSDHGEQFYDHGSWNHGNFLYNDTLKVPLLIKFPQAKFRGRKIQNIVRLIDVLPTVLEELGLTAADKNLDGRSLIPLLRGREKDSRVLFADVADKADRTDPSQVPQRVAMGSGVLKLILNKEFRKEYLESLAAQPPDIPPLELYNLGEDPLETKNIAAEKVDVVRNLAEQIRDFYQNAKKVGGTKAKISKELEDQLRALGYIR